MKQCKVNRKEQVSEVSALEIEKRTVQHHYWVFKANYNAHKNALS